MLWALWSLQLLCAPMGTASESWVLLEGLSHQASVRSRLHISSNSELSLAAQFTWLFSEMSLWVVFPAWSGSASADWQEFFKICHLLCAGDFPGTGVWCSRASLRSCLICSFCECPCHWLQLRLVGSTVQKRKDLCFGAVITFVLQGNTFPIPHKAWTNMLYAGNPEELQGWNCKSGDLETNGCSFLIEDTEARQSWDRVHPWAQGFALMSALRKLYHKGTD